jgi:hypothetical protein
VSSGGKSEVEVGWHMEKVGAANKGLKSIKVSKEMDSPLGECKLVPAQVVMYSASNLGYQDSGRLRLKAQSMGQSMLDAIRCKRQEGGQSTTPSQMP